MKLEERKVVFGMQGNYVFKDPDKIAPNLMVRALAATGARPIEVSEVVFEAAPGISSRPMKGNHHE